MAKKKDVDATGERSVCIKVSPDEQRELKQQALDKGLTIKDLILKALGIRK